MQTARTGGAPVAIRTFSASQGKSQHCGEKMRDTVTNGGGAKVGVVREGSEGNAGSLKLLLTRSSPQFGHRRPACPRPSRCLEGAGGFALSSLAPPKPSWASAVYVYSLSCWMAAWHVPRGTVTSGYLSQPVRFFTSEGQSVHLQNKVSNKPKIKTKLHLSIAPKSSQHCQRCGPLRGSSPPLNSPGPTQSLPPVPRGAEGPPAAGLTSGCRCG